MKPKPQIRRNCGRCSGFTLIEVVLATVIAVGMMLVVLVFYQQAAELRAQVLQQAEQLCAVRLLMDKLTGELRTTRSHPAFAGAFVGSADSIQFIKTDVPSRASWKSGAYGRAVSIETDLKLVGYRLSSAGATSTVETALTKATPSSTNAGRSDFSGVGATAPQSLVETNIAGVTRSEETLIATRQAAQTSTSSGSQPKGRNASVLLSDTIRFLRFRYWDGSNWQDTWSAAELPGGIEVSLGVEPLPSGIDPLEYPYEVFRRVVALPGGDLDKQPAATPGSLPKNSFAEVPR